MHYRVTVLILLTSSGIGVAKQYFGDPINCQVSKIDAMYYRVFESFEDNAAQE